VAVPANGQGSLNQAKPSSANGGHHCQQQFPETKHPLQVKKIKQRAAPKLRAAVHPTPAVSRKASTPHYLAKPTQREACPVNCNNFRTSSSAPRFSWERF